MLEHINSIQKNALDIFREEKWDKKNYTKTIKQKCMWAVIELNLYMNGNYLKWTNFSSIFHLSKNDNNIINIILFVRCFSIFENIFVFILFICIETKMVRLIENRSFVFNTLLRTYVRIFQIRRRSNNLRRKPCYNQ